jgi:predicted lipoprotein with Yx(FWY)xxD motif
LICVAAAAVLADCGSHSTASVHGGSLESGNAPHVTKVGDGAVGLVLLKTGTAGVRGEEVTALTDTRGNTLYFYDRDTPTSVSCTGSCARTWSPLLASGNQVQTPPGIHGSVSVVHGANGVQVAYNGHPLYTFSGDTVPGEAGGEGILGLWHVALPGTPAK